MIKNLAIHFRALPAKELAQRELEEAKRSLLETQSAVEYATALVHYNQSRVDRLAAYLRDDE